MGLIEDRARVALAQERWIVIGDEPASVDDATIEMIEQIIDRDALTWTTRDVGEIEIRIARFNEYAFAQWHDPQGGITQWTRETLTDDEIVIDVALQLIG